MAGRATLRDLLDDRPVRLEAKERTLIVPMDATSARVLTPEGG